MLIDNFLNELNGQARQNEIVPVMDEFYKEMFDKYVSNLHNQENRFEKFEEIYSVLINELVFDADYANACQAEDMQLDLTAIEIKQKDIERTKIDKMGGCKIFAMRISDELDKVGLNNWQMSVFTNNRSHIVNVYELNKKLFVADVTIDIAMKDLMELSKIPPVSINIPLKKYLKDCICPLFYRVDKENAKMNQIPVLHYLEFDQAYKKINNPASEKKTEMLKTEKDLGGK